MDWKKVVFNLVLIVIMLSAVLLIPLFPCKWQSGWEHKQRDLVTVPWTTCSYSDTMMMDAFPIFFGGILFVLLESFVIIGGVLFLANHLYDKRKKRKQI
jgi:hypothetical protein